MYAVTVCFSLEGGIMTCRVARSYQHFDEVMPIRCSQCGSAYRSVPMDSGILGPHLCPTCAQSMSAGGAWTEDATRVPMRHLKVA